MSNETNIMHQTVSTQSFEVLGETPKTNNKECSYDILPNDSGLEQNNDYDNYDNYDNEPQMLDEAIDDIMQVPQNSPQKGNLKPDSYGSKKEQIKNAIYLLKECGQNMKTRREIRSLERHLEKLEESEKTNVDYLKFTNMMKTNVKTDKNMNEYLKKIYSE